ncbi:metal ABC transporter substrate-binding protein [Thermocaproicibacter melissae]|jgi:zinc transport system substrate-binding protein|uniref:metal ABC transporter substrate-binding protein n=1 Tax=Thermocaproicibacter melissae TaxID=2966552 RepID=UPI0024B0D5F8|nr:metal ABC transporter substrate-binding protein [Thermocaproicibacter melissae]WBY63512.1 metal ABC transporter substrate-binding protein [Thermocaproicibacter melissae]
MLKKITAAVLSLLTVLSFSSCAGKQETSESGKVKVTVSFNALKEFTAAVGGDKVEISTMVPDGMEPHDFEPKAADIAALSQAKVFVINGLGMESWAEKAVAAAGNDNLIQVNASKGATPLKSADDSADEEHGQYDPHLWLSLKGAEIEVKNISDGLCEADPANAEYYKKNCESYTAKLESLFQEYKTKFSAAKKKTFVTGHAAFAYLCRDFGLEQSSVEDVFAEGEPSAKKLAQLADYCKKNNVKTVFVEKMVSPEISETLARQVGAKTVAIYTMEGAEDNKSYLDRAKANLSAIEASLKE